jgi:hypothetical protein
LLALVRSTKNIVATPPTSDPRSLQFRISGRVCP